MKKPIKGKEYLCIKTVVMDSGYTAYIKGKVYISEQNGCITDEKNNTNHFWTKKGMNKFFTEIQETFEITKETIIKYKMKDEFPEVFKVKLEVGKWYKTKSNCLFNLNEITDNFYLGYGFTKSMTYYGEFKEYIRTELKKATQQEVFESLKNEAVRRGFVEGNYFIEPENCVAYSDQKILIKGNVEAYREDNSMLCMSGSNSLIYKNGTWAIIIPTKTKEEAEKLLNCKIID